MFSHKTCSNHVSISDERSQICTVPDTEVLKNPNYHFFTRANWIFQSTPMTRTPANSNCFLFPFRVRVTKLGFYCIWQLLDEVDQNTVISQWWANQTDLNKMLLCFIFAVKIKTDYSMTNITLLIVKASSHRLVIDSHRLMKRVISISCAL